MRTFNDFTGLYPLSKTLRFELKPQGKTLEKIVESGILENDEHRAESYVKMKKLIDRFHKYFMERALTNGQLSSELLEGYYKCYNDKSDEKRNEKLEDIGKKMRKKIVDSFKKDEDYDRLFKKELIKEVLPAFVEKSDSEDEDLKQQELELIKEFSDFTTYFTGFHENRKNMYSEEDKSTAISYRLINQNLPKFIDNKNSFEKIMSVPELKDKMLQLYEDMKEYLNVDSIEELFCIEYYNNVLTQTQIDIYNAIIGGKSEGNKKIQGINEYVNLYNQQHKETKLPKLKNLFKQILSDRTAISWLPEEFKDDNDALKTIKMCYADILDNVICGNKLGLLLENIGTYDTSKIYLCNDLLLTNISNKLFDNWSVIETAVKAQMKSGIAQKRKETDEAYDERINKEYKKCASFSIEYLNRCLTEQTQTEIRIESYFSKLGKTKDSEDYNIFQTITNAYSALKPILDDGYPQKLNLAQDKDQVSFIKNLMDSLKALQRFIKPLLGDGSEAEKDENFYGELDYFTAELDQFTPIYNMVRNYLTRKPYSQNKIKLNFENSTLMAGWDKNKESDNTTIILRRNGLYYLAIMNKKYNKVFSDDNIESNGECYDKMNYKLLPGVNKMLPKVFFSKSRIDEFAPSEDILRIKEKETFKKGDNFSLEDCHALIDFYKQSIAKHEDWKNFGFKYSETSSYEDISGFYREVERQGYKITFNKVSVAYIDKLVEEGKIYLFQIYNKDFSSFSKGTPNMHTLYWKMLFDERNLGNVIYKLNGQAEVFFRKRSLNYLYPTHPAGIPIKNKNKENQKQESTFTYDLTKNKRYTIDKFLFHVPITMNFGIEGNGNINDQVREFLQSSDDAHIIGIDRGERHLLYLVVIDQKGIIKEQFTLNEIMNEYNGNTYKTNYHDLLDEREKGLHEERKNWQTIETIKELKEGYLSQVIFKISQLMIKYHAIVVLEDLNLGFMRGRQKVEKQVYQKFEHQLIDKLNYMVSKSADADENGGLLKAYQLASKFESFEKLGKQSGFLFYIPAWNTSKIDPVTGFVNLLDTRYHNQMDSREFFGKFDDIRFNSEKGYFEFKLDYNKFGSKADGSQTNWTICTYGTRIRTFRNELKNSQWDNIEINLTEEFKTLFRKHGIDYEHVHLKESIIANTETKFFVELHELLKLTLQMRNSITGTEVDYLLSPIANSEGLFYDSRKVDNTLPKNADANGAYNIARKGLMIIDQIKKANNFANMKFDITNKSWLQFAQQKPYKK